MGEATFVARLSNAAFFVKFLKAVNTLVDEANLKVGPDGIKVRCMDGTRVALVDAVITRDAFEELSCEEESEVGINLAQVIKLIKRARKDEAIEMVYDKDSAKVTFRIIGKYSRSYSFPSLELAVEPLPAIRELPYTAILRVMTGELKRAITDLGKLADAVTLRATKNGLSIVAESELGEATIDLSTDSAALLEFEIKEDQVTALYDLEYLTNLVKAGADLSDSVEMKFFTDGPLCLTHELNE